MQLTSKISTVIVTATLLVSCSTVTLDEIENAEKAEKAENIVEMAEVSPTMTLDKLESVPTTLAPGDRLCGMLVLEVHYYEKTDIGTYAPHYHVTLLSNNEWVNVPSAYATGDNALCAEHIAEQSTEAGDDGWNIPTKEQARLIHDLCTDLNGADRYLCNEGLHTFSKSSTVISKAGAKKRYRLRLVLEAIFVDDTDI